MMRLYTSVTQFSTESTSDNRKIRKLCEVNNAKQVSSFKFIIYMYICIVLFITDIQGFLST